MFFEMIYVACIYGIVAMVVALIISPLQFLKVQRQQTHRGYFHLFCDFVKSKGFLILYIGALPYAYMSFLSNFAFGFSDYFFTYIDRNIVLSSFSRVMILSSIGGILETLFIFYPEVNEICSNKLYLLETDKKLYFRLIPDMVLRNSVSWIAVALMFEIDSIFNLSFVLSGFCGAIFSILFSLISIPLDIAITRNCGAKLHINTVRMISSIIKQRKSYIFLGAMMRIIQIVIFTLTTFLTMVFIRNFIYCE